MAVGEAIGAGANFITGLIGQYQTDKARSRARQAIDSWNTDATKMLDDYEAGQQSFSSPTDMETYQKMKSDFNPDDYIYNFDKFDSSKYNVEDYVNQNKDRILADVGKGVIGNAAGAGLGHSSGAYRAMVNEQMDKSESLYNDAYNRMNTDRNFDYTEYQNYIQNMQNKLTQQMQGKMAQMDMYRTDLQTDQTQAAENLDRRLSLGNSTAQSKASIV